MVPHAHLQTIDGQADAESVGRFGWGARSLVELWLKRHRFLQDKSGGGESLPAGIPFQWSLPMNEWRVLADESLLTFYQRDL
ncbi:MAG: hypothetical protein ACKVU0_09970 [Saprospiraceae bacterium]